MITHSTMMYLGVVNYLIPFIQDPNLSTVGEFISNHHNINSIFHCDGIPIDSF